ncbi:tRNA preQ1(34) S-adenosylmethionine ribosyltransferase-isomerase QueA [Glycomyces artemisiae]|uniref:S-adenosylmethionine--tRNA ribosyltransferase-isomerase n=1 Tax=Glycomyces artemisiae TaxID=1076443 RepID=A0A2T0UL30_9ACTN|nr:tRNA preQ1(34) S-adenosylmethionine ribosyltransferase-isomerase QueA [Glycomyces artemisiae]PRY58639.1 S-adenosylmethionine--tRNA ribosyltransferase-isomerase [Glycomyces artemisiae]
METSKLNFQLPAHLLARQPIERRGGERHDSKMVVYHKRSETVEFTSFREIPRFLEPGDVVVINDSRTLNASVFANVEDRGRVEVQLRYNPKDNIWGVSSKSRRAPRIGSKLTFDGTDITATMLGPDDRGLSLWMLEFDCEFDALVAYLDEHGRPIPSLYVEGSFTNEEYNSVYAERPGSAEMPAAGRHFTEEVLTRLRERGVGIAYITLHTGLSSVEISEEHLEDHRMHAEWCQIPPETADMVNTAKDEGHRVLVVGTTVMRTLESAAKEDGLPLRAGDRWTDLYIYPGFDFQVADAFVTNFHGPRSSRIALASAFTGADLLLHGYDAAIERGLQFYEFGDTTLTLPD